MPETTPEDLVDRFTALQLYRERAKDSQEAKQAVSALEWKLWREIQALGGQEKVKRWFEENRPATAERLSWYWKETPRKTERF